MSTPQPTVALLPGTTLAKLARHFIKTGFDDIDLLIMDDKTANKQYANSVWMSAYRKRGDHLLFVYTTLDQNKFKGFTYDQCEFNTQDGYSQEQLERIATKLTDAPVTRKKRKGMWWNPFFYRLKITNIWHLDSGDFSFEACEDTPRRIKPKKLPPELLNP